MTTFQKFRVASAFGRVALVATALGAAMPSMAADIAWIDDAANRGTASAPIDMYDAAKWSPANLPSASEIPWFVDAAMTYVTNTCPNAATTAIANHAAIIGDFTFLGDYYYSGTLYAPWSGFGGSARDTTIVKSGDWSLNQFVIGGVDNMGCRFRSASGGLTVRGQDFKIASASGATVGVEKDAGDWTFDRSVYLGAAAGATAAFTNHSGNITFNGMFQAGNNGAGGNADLTVDGGVITFSNKALVGGNGWTCTVVKNGGTFAFNRASTDSDGSVSFGYGGGGGVTYVYHNGGDMTVAGNLNLTRDGSTEFNMNGGNVTVAMKVVCGSWSLDSGEFCRLNLNGGVFATPCINYHNHGGPATVTFNGGTLRITANGAMAEGDYNGNGDWSNIANLSTVLSFKVAANGGTIDTAGHAVTMPLALSEDSGSTGGGMTFTGGGSISLGGAVDYTGRTYLDEKTHLEVKDEATKNAILARGLTVVKPGDASPKGTYTLLSIADGTACTAADLSSVTLGAGLESATLSIVGGAITISVTKETQVWAGAANTSLAWGGANWNGGATWDDGNDAVFETDGAIASVDAAAEASSVTFSDNATVAGSATLTPGTVSVAAGKSATISAPTTGSLTKTGAGTLTLGASRSDATTLSEGTLVMDGSGTTLDWSDVAFGADSAKPLMLGFTGGAALTGLNSNVKISEVANSSVAIDKDGGNWTFGGVVSLGAAAGATAAFTNHSGNITFNGMFQAGNNGAGGNADFTVENGVVTFTDKAFVGGNGWTCTVVKNGGTFAFNRASDDQNGSVSFGYGGGGGVTYVYHNGGDMTVAGSLNLTRDGSAEFNMNGGNVTVAMKTACGSWNLNGSEFCRLNLNGGVFSTPCINYHNGGAAATVTFNGGTLRITADGAMAEGDYNSNGDWSNIDNLSRVLFFKVAAGGGTIDAAGHAVTMPLALSEDSGSTGGGMTFTGGGSVALASGNTYTGVTTVEVGTALSVPAPIAGDKLAFTISAGLADGLYAVVSVTGDGAFTAADIEAAAKPAGEEFILSGDMKTIYCIHGNVENSWTGGTSGSLTNPDSWVLRRVPGNGETAVINTAAAATLTIPDGVTFAPSAIVFPAGCAAVTIFGDITGLAAITNNTTANMTFRGFVDFGENDIDVTQTATLNDSMGAVSGGVVNFAGGVRGVNLRNHKIMTGNYELTSTGEFSFTSTGADRYAINTNSSLSVTRTDRTEELRILSGGTLTTGTGRCGWGNSAATHRLWFKSLGTYVANTYNFTGSGTQWLGGSYPSGTDGTLKIGTLNVTSSGSLWLHGYAGNESNNIYIGEGGINITGFGCVGIENANHAQTLWPLNADYAIGRGSNENYDFRLVNDNIRLTLQTTDEGGTARTVTLNGRITTETKTGTTITVAGAGTNVVNSASPLMTGTYAVADTATLSIAPGAGFPNGTILLAAGTTLALAPNVDHTLSAPAATIALPETGAATLSIDGSWLKGGDYILGAFSLPEGYDVSDHLTVIGTAVGVGPTLKVEGGNLILAIKPRGTRIIFR